MHILNVFNAVCNLERITSFAMISVSVVPEIAMLCTTKNGMERRLTTTMMTIKIASNYEIHSDLYVFYYHCSCILLLPSFFCYICTHS